MNHLLGASRDELSKKNRFTLLRRISQRQQGTCIPHCLHHFFADYNKASNFSLNIALEPAPTVLSTNSPFLKNRTVGTLRIPKRVVRSEFSSTSHLPTLTRPSYSSANSSIIGAIFLQGPHHVAQKSTTRGSPAFNSLSKFASVIIFSIVTIYFGWIYIIEKATSMPLLKQTTQKHLIDRIVYRLAVV